MRALDIDMIRYGRFTGALGLRADPYTAMLACDASTLERHSEPKTSSRQFRSDWTAFMTRIATLPHSIQARPISQGAVEHADPLSVHHCV